MFDLPLGFRIATVTTFAYAVGCLNAGYYLVRARHGTDLRSVHSGNAGATNAGRILGRGGFAAVLLLDAAKGVLATAIGLWLADYAGGACGALAAVCGHIWPAQLGFRGGKGIAAAVGTFGLLEPTTTACTVGFALALFAVTRRWSASGLLAVVLSPAFALVSGRPPRAMLAVAIAALVVLIAHRDDLRAVRVHSEPGAPR